MKAKIIADGLNIKRLTFKCSNCNSKLDNTFIPTMRECPFCKKKFKQQIVFERSILNYGM